jgi:hypothetical protein
MGKFINQSHIIDKENGMEYWQMNFRVLMDKPLTADEWELAMMNLEDYIHKLIHKREGIHGFHEGDRVRVWLEDSMEPEGGSFAYGTLHTVSETKFKPLAFIEDGFKGKMEDLDTISFFIGNGYKVDKI